LFRETRIYKASSVRRNFKEVAGSIVCAIKVLDNDVGDVAVLFVNLCFDFFFEGRRPKRRLGCQQMQVADHQHDDDPFIVLTETKFSIHQILSLAPPTIGPYNRGTHRFRDRQPASALSDTRA
jgi:hypothetical protein